MMDFISVRILFESMEDATQALIMILEHSRESGQDYTFGSLSPDQILTSGLLIIGDADDISQEIAKLPTATLYRS